MAVTPPRAFLHGWGLVLPGLVLCLAVAGAADALGRAEAFLLGRAYLDALVLAILLGMALRTAWRPPASFEPGIAFSAKTLLEVAVTLLGASLSLQLVLSVGPGLVAGIAAVVAIVVAGSLLIGRALGLPLRTALLIASGNAICGNSAIAAVAPVIGAAPREVASAITFTAVLGVAVVLLLPLLVPLASLTEPQYGVVAGLTVYAVPQVLAATNPVGPLAVQVGTFVKLVRVLMLGPLVVALSLLGPRLFPPEEDPAAATGAPPGPGRPAARPGPGRLVPPFILGFLLLMTLRSLDWLPDALLAPIGLAAKLLTVVAMAALGLGVDVRAVARASGPVVATVCASLALLVLFSLLVIASGLVR